MSPIRARTGLLEMVARVGELTIEQRKEPQPRMIHHQVGRSRRFRRGKEVRSQLARGF